MWDLGAMKNAHKRVRYTRLWYQLQQARNFSAWWIYSITKYKLPFHWGKKLSGSSLSYLPTSRPDSLLRISKTSSDVDVLCKEGLAKKKGVPWLDPAVQGHLHRTQRNFPASVEQRQSYLANHSWTRTQWCMRYNQWLEKSAPTERGKSWRAWVMTLQPHREYHSKVFILKFRSKVAAMTPKTSQNKLLYFQCNHD